MANEKIVNRENLKAFRQAYDTRLENGTLVPEKSQTAKNLLPVSSASGSTQTAPFINQGTATNNNDSQAEVDTGTLGQHLEKQGHTLVVNQLVNIGTTEILLINDHKYYTLIDNVLSIVNGTGQNISIVDDTKDIVIDITQMFNGDIPQDLLDNPSNFFRYYNGSLDYNTGTLVNSNGRYLVNGGQNVWNEQWELGGISGTTGQNSSSNEQFRSKDYIQVIPNRTYYFNIAISNGYLGVMLYDKDKNFITGNIYLRNETYTLPSNCQFIRFKIDGTTYNHDITISLYYAGEDYSQYVQYEQPKVYDTGDEVLRQAGSIKDYKEPNGTIHRLVGNRAYQSGDENDSSLLTDGTTTNYPLETPTTEQGTPFAENMDINDMGNMAWYSAYTDENTNTLVSVPQGCKIFYPAWYVGFLDSLGQRADIEWSADNVVSQSELSASETQRDTVDTQLKNAIGGTLRQCLSVKESLDFNNTSIIDLNSLTWSYLSAQEIFYANVSGKANGNKILTTKYQSVDTGNWAGISNMQIVGNSQNATIYIKDTTYIDATTFKNAMKGVLLAYEKA